MAPKWLDQLVDDGEHHLKDGRDETPQERADRNWAELLQELRIVQTATQIFTGFLLAVAFQPAFAALQPHQKAVYLVLVVLGALSVVLALTPVVVHRVLFGRLVKPVTVRLGAVMLPLALAAVFLLLVGMVYLMFSVAWSTQAAFWVAGVACVLLTGMWVVGPVATAALVRRTRERHHP